MAIENIIQILPEPDSSRNKQATKKRSVSFSPVHLERRVKGKSKVKD
jgi:hypothetical protein